MIRFNEKKNLESIILFKSKFETNLFWINSFKSLFDTIVNFKANYLSLDKWAKWYISFIVDLPTAYRGTVKPSDKPYEKIVDFDDDIAVEVLNYRKKLSNFGGKYSLS